MILSDHLLIDIDTTTLVRCSGHLLTFIGVADAKWDTSHGDGYQWNTSDKVTTSASGNYTGAIGDLENGTGTGGNDAAVNGHYKNGAGAGGEGGGDNPCRKYVTPLARLLN